MIFSCITISMLMWPLVTHKLLLCIPTLRCFHLCEAFLHNYIIRWSKLLMYSVFHLILEPYLLENMKKHKNSSLNWEMLWTLTLNLVPTSPPLLSFQIQTHIHFTVQLLDIHICTLQRHASLWTIQNIQVEFLCNTLYYDHFLYQIPYILEVSFSGKLLTPEDVR